MLENKVIFVCCVLFLFYWSTNEAFIKNNFLVSFDKYWTFFETFTPCTIHLSFFSLSTEDLQHSFLKYCSLTLNAKCVIILQTGDDSKASRKNAHLTIKLNYSFDYTHNNLLKTIKYGNFCLLDLPSVNLIDQRNRSISQYLAQNHENFVATTGKLFQPDFTLFQFTGVLKFVDVSPYTTSQLFFLSEISYGIYTACINCLLFTISPYFDYTVNMKVYPISNEIPIVKFGSILRKFVMSLNNHNKIKETCAYKTTHDSVRQIPTPDACLKTSFLSLLNCSQFEVCHHLVISYFKVPVSRMDMLHAHVVSHAAVFYGSRYTLFYEKPKGKWENVSVFSLLSPFEWYGWVLILGASMLVGSTLKIIGFDDHPYFWLFCTFLEGGDDAKWFLNRHNFILILIWLLPFSLLLRNTYTSSLYSLITKDPGPGNIPATFDEILNNNDIKYLSDDDHHYNILTKMGEWSKYVKPNQMFKLKSVFEKLSSNESVTEVIQNLFNSKDGLVSCDSLDGIMEVVYSYYSLNKTFHNGTCLARKMFALLTSSDDVLEGVIVDKMLADLLDQFHLFESNEPSSFSELSVWLSDKSSYVEKPLSHFVAALSETGILNYQQYQYDMIVIRIELQNILSSYFNNHKDMRTKSMKALHKWTICACLRLYKKICSLADINENYDKVIGVSVYDLKVLWMLFGILVLTCLVTFFKEIRQLVVGKIKVL